MDLSKMKKEELLFMLKKRQIDLQVIGMDIKRNKRVDPESDNAISSRINDLVELARELTSRKQAVKIDLSRQHPLIAKRFETAIQKSGLIKTLPAPQKKAIPKKKPVPRLPKRRI